MLHEAGIGVLARGVVMRGLLSGKAPVSYLGHTAAGMASAAELIAGMVDEGGSPARVATRWVLDHAAISSAVVGVRTMEQLEDVVRAADERRLTVDERRILEMALAGKRYEEHR
jgi:aryl-alcohol dehydrogenase-like predicted oxidoreductase